MNSKDFVTFAELDSGEVRDLIDLAVRLKSGSCADKLDGKVLAMIFEKPSTRTRVSFEVAMQQLGGSSVALSSGDMQLSRGESIEDTARTLSLYTDVIMARVFDHSALESLATSASVPVINGLSNSFHPCQTLADLMTIHEKKGRTKGLKLAWVGDGNNVCNSMVYGCARAGINMSIATPRGFEPLSGVVKEARRITEIDITDDPLRAVAGADVIMTDTFTSIHNTEDRTSKFLPKFQVDDSLMTKANDDAIFMHCLPAKRGQEVTASVIDGPHSVVWDEAENRLHSQKALLLLMLGR